MKRVFAGVLCLLVTTTIAVGVIWAGDISPHANGPWLGFSFRSPGVDARGCSPADPGGLSCALTGNSTQADAAPWTFVVGSGGATLEAVDAFSTGDEFEVFNSNVSLGTTSDAPTGNSCGGDPDGCVGTSASYGLFALAPGQYSITIRPVVSPLNIGLAYFRIDGDVTRVPPPPVDSDGDGVLDPDDQCPASVVTDRVIIADCNSGVSNLLFQDGCTLADRVLECGNGSQNHGVEVSCATHLLNELKESGNVSGHDKAAILACVASAQ